MTREETILSLTTQVELLAKRQFFRLPRNTAVSLEDLISEAWVGAIRSVDRYDPSTGNKLSTFAEFNIRGHMLDYLRSLDLLSRHERLKINRGEVEPSRIPVQVALEIVGPSGKEFERTIPDERCDRSRESQEARIDTTRILGQAKLRARTAAIVRRVFLREESQIALSVAYGLSPSRVSQILADGIEQLRRSLKPSPK